MVRCVVSKLQEAQQVKEELLSLGYIDHSFQPLKEEGNIYFPVTNAYKGESVEKQVQKRKEKTGALPFKETLQKILNAEELEIVKTAYEVVGNIAIIEVPEEIEDKEKEIGESLLQSNPLLKTVLKKSSRHDGVYRTQKMTTIAGKDTKVATYKENNCTITFNVEQVYFSARLSTERKRISQMVKEGEDVLVMFSGAAPYPCVIAKNTGAKKIIGVEINRKGHEYALKNLNQNKIKNVKLFCGDVRVVVPQLQMTFDRIIMPLPKTAEEFLDVALPVAKKGCVIHLYAFYHIDEFEKAHEEIERYCKKFGREYKILSTTKCGQHAPRTYRICVDVEVLN